jgi:hypothetical protein
MLTIDPITMEAKRLVGNLIDFVLLFFERWGTGAPRQPRPVMMVKGFVSGDDHLDQPIGPGWIIHGKSLIQSWHESQTEAGKPRGKAFGNWPVAILQPFQKLGKKWGRRLGSSIA